MLILPSVSRARRTHCSTGNVALLGTTLLRPGNASLSAITGNMTSFMCVFLSVDVVEMRNEEASHTSLGMAGCERRQLAARNGLQDSLCFGRQSVHRSANELLQVRFALDEEFTADSRELVRPVFCHLQGELLHLSALEQHRSSSPVPLYLSWERTHSGFSTSFLGPKYTG